MNVQENWKCIAGFEGRYAVSDFGNVMAMDYKGSGLPGLLSQSLRNGYPRVTFDHDNAQSVHVLVAEAFTGARPDGKHVNHIDGVKTNNMLSNLEWVTPSENMKHAHAMGLQSNKGEKHSQAKLTEEKVREIRRMLKMGFKQSEVAKMMDIHATAISRIHLGQRWGHVGDVSDHALAKNQDVVG